VTGEVDSVWPGGAPVTGQTVILQREITTRDIELLTEISGDRNPLHYDAAYAETTPLAGL
jgi:acyl dehydratase